MAFIKQDKPSNFGPTSSNPSSRWVPDNAEYGAQFGAEDDPNRMVTVPESTYDKTRFGYFRQLKDFGSLAPMLLSMLLSLRGPQSVREELEDNGQQVSRGVPDKLLTSANVNPLAIRPRRRPA